MKTSTDLRLRYPPVVETALNIQFSDLANWKAVHHGLLFAELRQRYPIYEHRQDLQPLSLPFPLGHSNPSLQLSSIPPSRAEFAKDDHSELIAVQNNRFAYHWRMAGDGPYPNYRTNRVHCEREFSSFVDFCQREGIGDVRPVLVEVMYVNKISPQEGETLAQACEGVLGLSLGEFEATAVNRTYAKPDKSGRLYAELSTASLAESPYLSLKLSSRLRHKSDRTVMDTMDSAHDWLIEKFVELTSESVRMSRWGQYDC